jgi:hypothetical protein
MPPHRLRREGPGLFQGCRIKWSAAATVVLSCVMTIAFLSLYLSMKPRVDHEGAKSGSYAVNQGLHAVEGSAAARSGSAASTIEQQAASKPSRESGSKHPAHESRQQAGTSATQQRAGSSASTRPSGREAAQQQQQQQQQQAISSSSSTSSSSATQGAAPQCNDLTKEFLAAHAVNNTIIMAACDWHMFEVRPGPPPLSGAWSAQQQALASTHH